MKKSLRNIIEALRFVWRSSPQLTIAQLVILVILSLLPLINLYVIKLLIDEITTQSNQTAYSFYYVGWYLGIMGSVMLVVSLFTILSQYIATALKQRVSDYMSKIIQEKSVEIDLQFYEDPKYHDTLHRAQNQGLFRPVMILNSLTSILESGLSLIAIAGLLIWLHWSIAIVLIISALPALFIKVYFSKKLFDWERKVTQPERESIYLNMMLTVDKFVKEIRIFDVAQTFIDRFSDLRAQIYKEKMSIVTKQSKAEVGGKAIEILATISIYAYVAYRTVKGAITAGGFVMYYQAFQRGQGALKTVLSSVASLYENRLFLQYLFEFLDIQHEVKDPEQPLALPKIEDNIRFENVSFRYPSSTTDILKNVNLSFKKGQVIAIVGENGSGKTTLIKLLCRLYDVSEGQILFDNQNIKQISLSDVRQKISVIFQDFAQYYLSVKENIAISNMHEPLNMANVEEAAKRTGAHEFVATMGKGYDNMLGLRFKSGNELSGGQWQKIALARAFYKQSDVIVLDEPTSAIDPLAEYDIFEQLRTFAADKILVLITHRLYNLKMADQIIVMDKGQVIEQGTHEELAALGGKYFKMFEKQM